MDLLPQNATPLEQTFAEAGARITAIPVPIDLLKRPADVPQPFLPALAFELSVDIWKNGWSSTRQRVVTAAAPRLHFKKGTAYCLREYARYADSDVVHIERPPMRVFSGRSLTKAEREAWLSGLPQIRLWRIREFGIAGAHKAFLGAANSSRLRSSRFFMEWAAATPSTALQRLKRRARWVVDGVETDTRVSNVGTAFRLHLPGTAGKRVFSGQTFGLGHFFIVSDAWKRLVTVEPRSALPWRSAVGPTLQAVISEPERVKVAGTRGRSIFCDVPSSPLAFYVPSSAPLRIFWRFPVLRPGARAPRPVVQFMGVGRYGFPAHTARVRMSIPGRRNQFAAAFGFMSPRRRFLFPHNPARLIEARLAASASKRLSDRMLFQIGPVARFVAGGKPVLADIDTIIVGKP